MLLDCLGGMTMNNGQIYAQMTERNNSTRRMFNTLRTDVTFKKSFAQLREQAFRLATEADPEWKSPRAMRILEIYQRIGRKYMW